MLHRLVPPSQNHVAHSIEFADINARNSYIFNPADANKLALQIDTGELFIIRSSGELIQYVTSDGMNDAINSQYIHDQATPSAVWVISHNLNKYPAVTIVDSSGNVVEGDIQYSSPNQINITFISAFAGKAYL